MFGTFMRFLLWRMPQNLLLVVPLLPVVGLGMLVQGRATRWPMSLLLWSITFGHREAKLKDLELRFVNWFRQKVVVFPVVQMRLRDYIENHDAEVWLITGSPENLVQQVYNTPFFGPGVPWVGGGGARGKGGGFLPFRCRGGEKGANLN